MDRRFTLSDPRIEGSLHDLTSFRKLIGLGWGSCIPDKRTILQFHRLLKGKKLRGQVLALVNDLPLDQGVMINADSVIAATSVEARHAASNSSTSLLVFWGIAEHRRLLHLSIHFTKCFSQMLAEGQIVNKNNTLYVWRASC